VTETSIPANANVPRDDA